ncbi:MAG: hypothetical protein WD602_05670 [Actinomycetota bacterium]
MKTIGSRYGTEVEKLVAGKAPAAGSGLDVVVRVIDGVKATYLNNPDPDLEAAQLMGLMRMVHLSEKGDLAVRPASKVNGPDCQVSGLPTRRRRFMFETLFASLAAKIAAGGIAVAMASTGAVAATGNLPDQMQTGISQAVEKIGIEVPLGETAALEQAALEEEAEESNENADFGRSVSEDAKDGGVDGKQVSDDAREMAEERKAAGQSNRPEGTPEGGAEEAGTQQSTAGEQVGDTPGAEYVPSEVPAGSDAADQYKPEGVGGGRP